MPEIKSVVFDAYGTLFDVKSIAGECRRMFGAAGDDLCALWRDKQLEYTWLRSLMGRYEDFDRVTADALRYAAGKLGLTIDRAGVDRLMELYDRLDAYPEVPDTMRLLAGRRPMILSNGNRAMLAAVVDHSGLGDVFERLISAESAGVFKPDPRVYALACTETGLSPEEIVFVSSNFFDVAGARAFGFLTVWVNRRGDRADEMDLAATEQSDSLSRLPQLLDSLE